ncbi:MAG: glycosyltransferase [bacterium]
MEIAFFKVFYKERAGLNLNMEAAIKEKKTVLARGNQGTSSKFPDESPQLSVIIVNYNVKEFLEQALVSIRRALKGLAAEIIVVDNASTDGSQSMLRSAFKDVRVIQNKQNMGFAKACNQGLELAHGDYLVLINPDTIVQEDTFAKLLGFMKQHADTGMVGCKILNPDGSLQLACRRSFPTPWVAFTRLSGLSRLFPKTRLFGRYNLTYLDPEQSYEVEAISGSLMMIRRDVLSKVGCLDESFFMYGEDLDWCYRIRQGGLKVRYFSGTQIIHFKGESSKRMEFDRLRVFYRAMLLFVKKHFKKKSLFMPYWLLWVAIWIRGGFSFLNKLLIKISMPLTDAAFLSGSMMLSVYLRFGNLSHLWSFLPVIVVYTLVWILSLRFFESYHRNRFSLSTSAMAVVVGFLVNSSFTFFFKQYAFSRAVLLFGGILSVIAVPGWRLLVKMLPRLGLGPFKGTFGKTLLARNTVIVGEPDAGQKLANKIDSQIESGYHIRGLVSINGMPAGENNGTVEVLGAVEDLNEIIKNNNIQEVIFSTHKLSYYRILQVIACSGSAAVNFKLAPSDFDVVIGKASIESIHTLPLLDIHYRLHQTHYCALKRGFDLVLLLALSPLWLPIFLFKKYIIGERLQVVTIQSVHGLTSLFEFAEDSSNFIRKVPYAWAILKGTLSFVGSEIIKTSEKVEDGEIKMKPGLTGLCQINKHKQLSSEERSRYDIYYMKNYSPFLDLEIIIKALLKL